MSDDMNHPNFPHLSIGVVKVKDEGNVLATKRSTARSLPQGTSFSHSTSKINSSRQRMTVYQKIFSMRVMLLCAFAVPVLGLAATSYATTTVSISTTTNDLSTRILDSISERVAEHTHTIFAGTWNLSSALAREIPTENPLYYLQYEQLRPILWKVWQNSNGAVVTVWTSLMDGSNTAYYRNTVASPDLHLITANQTTGYAFFATVDMSNNLGLVNLSDPSIYLPASDLDLTQAVFWKDSLTHKSQFWTQTYWDKTLKTGVIWNTCIHPVIDPATNETVAFLGIDQTSTNLRDYLAEIYISKNAEVWLMKPSTGLLIASNNPNERTYTDPDIDGLTYAQDSNLDIVKYISLYILNNTNSKDSYSISYTLHGSKIKAEVVAVSDHDLELVLIVAYPESDFLGEVYTIQRQILIISSVAFAVSIVFSLFVIIMITVPLTKLGKKMNEIANGSFDLIPTNSNSRLFELRSLEHDFHSMVNALRSFGRFVPTDVVRYLLRNNEEATTGVVQRDLTVMFSDIVGFTNKVEVMSPAQLSMLLSEYLNSMCAVIGENKGTVDKFIGDAIMALWNVPSPVSNHSMHACETALQSLHQLDQLNNKWSAAGLPDIRCRIGIHTGRALVGNLGSKERLSFTAIGDNINLGSRLESLNKKYGTSILISGEVYDLVKQHYLCRFLDVVIVQGKTTPTRIYELVNRIGDATQHQQLICRSQAEAVNFYLNKDFESALGVLYQLKNTIPNDMSISLLIDRAQKALANINSLPANWTGHLVLDEK